MKPGDIVTWSSAARRDSLEKDYGPGPYSIIGKGIRIPKHKTWNLARLSDGEVFTRVSFHEEILQISTFLSAAREAIHEAEV